MPGLRVSLELTADTPALLVLSSAPRSLPWLGVASGDVTLAGTVKLSISSVREWSAASPSEPQWAAKWSSGPLLGPIDRRAKHILITRRQRSIRSTLTVAPSTTRGASSAFPEAHSLSAICVANRQIRRHPRSIVTRLSRSWNQFCQELDSEGRFLSPFLRELPLERPR